MRAITPSDFPWFKYSDYTFSLGLMLGDDAFLSGHSASEFDPESKKMVVKGDMAAQTRTAYAKIERILEAEGLTFADVVRVVENVTVSGIKDYPLAEAVRKSLFGSAKPAITTVVVDRLLRPAALIEIEVHATRAGGKSESGTVEVADGTVYLPTMLPTDEKGEVVFEGDFVGQYRYCLEIGRAHV